MAFKHSVDSLETVESRQFSKSFWARKWFGNSWKRVSLYPIDIQFSKAEKRCAFLMIFLSHSYGATSLKCLRT